MWVDIITYFIIFITLLFMYHFGYLDGKEWVMDKFYITFGQIYVHSVNGKTFDKDCFAEIKAETREEAHKIAMDFFNKKFHNCHSKEKLPEIINYYPRGIIKLINEDI